MGKNIEQGDKEYFLEELGKIKQEYKQKGKTKDFWVVVRGITGKDYKNLDGIPEDEIVEILTFFIKNKRTEKCSSHM